MATATQHREQQLRGAVVAPGARRDFLRRVVLASSGVPVVLGLGACTDSSSELSGNGTRTLRVAHYKWIGNVAKWLPELKAQFEEANPGVTVKFSPLASDELTSADSLVQKFTLEARQERATYDLILGPTPWIEVGALAKSGAILALDDLVTTEHTERLVDQARLEGIAPDGRTYSIPFWTDIIGFLSRPDLLRQFDVRRPRTWDELSATVDALSGRLPIGTFAYGGDWTFIHRSFLPILVTLTDRPFTENGTIDVASPAALRALEIMGQLERAMPPNANKSLGSAEVFQARKLLMATYWQAQHQRSREGGLGADESEFTSNLVGDRPGTLFWNVSGVVPKHSPVPELAVKFMTDGLLGEFALTQSVIRSGRTSPVKDLSDIVELPEWLNNAYTQLSSGTVLPCNDAFMSIEQPAFKKEIERMVIDKSSPVETQAALVSEFSGYRW
ncbi:ABC transporter substrate-binding protein [Microlunatus sp. GCM10028923]|uniref:ABC transporter substrate-binding protein n=1 Tax=Microlunatus sp. GCM10028923 TaxID=3273400 RepID=UPI0036158CCF